MTDIFFYLFALPQRFSDWAQYKIHSSFALRAYLQTRGGFKDFWQARFDVERLKVFESNLWSPTRIVVLAVLWIVPGDLDN